MTFNHNYTKSLGELRLNKKTKERSPDLIGALDVHRSLIEWLWKEINTMTAESVKCNLASWQYRDRKGQVLRVQLSEKYTHSQREPLNIFDIMNKEDEESTTE